MFWYNGELLPSCTLELTIDEPGLLYGATVFTTLRVYHESLDTPLTNWARHCNRLKTTLCSFSWQQPDWQRLRQGAEVMIKTWPVLRIALFPDGREFIIGRTLPPDLANRQQKGITAWLAPAGEFQRSLPLHKTGNYLSSLLARQTAQRMGAEEAILVDASGSWLETSTGNLWGWRDGHWWTPSLEGGILPGLTRSLLLNWLEQQEKPAIEEPWSAEVVRGFEAIAISNSVVEVAPIREILTPQEILTYDPCHEEFQHLRSLFR